MNQNKKIILLAGGSGFIGKRLQQVLSKKHEVRVLTRDRSKCNGNFYFWNPDKGELDEKAAEGVTHLINLCGAGITDKRWTAARKKELYDSRIRPAAFLFSKRDLFPRLEHYISASGVNCFDWKQKDRIYNEDDVLAPDFISQLVSDWEKEADRFAACCRVSKIRISFVISREGGGLGKIEKPIRMGFGAVLGSGNQAMPWIHLEDLVLILNFVMERQLQGVYHAVAGNTTNRELTRLLAEYHEKRLWVPAVPVFVLRLLLGEMSNLVTEGVKISGQKIRQAGFVFQYPELSEAIRK